MSLKKVNKWKGVKINTHKNSGEIVTQPNQTMSIREILFRNTQGMTYDNYKTPYYEDQATFSSQALNKIQEMEKAAEDATENFKAAAGVHSHEKGNEPIAIEEI